MCRLLCCHMPQSLDNNENSGAGITTVNFDGTDGDGIAQLYCSNKKQAAEMVVSCGGGEGMALKLKVVKLELSAVVMQIARAQGRFACMPAPACSSHVPASPPLKHHLWGGQCCLGKLLSLQSYLQPLSLQGFTLSC